MARLRKSLTLCLSFIIFLLLPACLFKKNTISSVAIHNKKIPLFIQMPHNPLAFDDISSLVYSTLHEHCMNVGYILVDSSNNGYTLRTRIKGLEPTQKLVSPDIVLVHTYISLDLECELLNFNQKLVERKRFSFSALVSKPRNPVLVSDFIMYSYEKLLRRSAPKIERFFRPTLLKAFSEEE